MFYQGIILTPCFYTNALLCLYFDLATAIDIYSNLGILYFFHQRAAVNSVFQFIQTAVTTLPNYHKGF